MDLSSLLADAIYNRRADYKLTQAELAERTRVSRGVIIRLENGDAAHVSMGTIERVLGELNMRLDLQHCHARSAVLTEDSEEYKKAIEEYQERYRSSIDIPVSKEAGN